ncbi:MAG: TonB-dependent receptor, partial [Woeseiaceae bacterium]
MRVGVLFTCVLAAMLSASAVAQEATRLALRDYLVALNEAGTRVIFSSDLVNDDMIIDAPGSGADPIAALREILPEFGLRLDDGPAGAYLIVQADVSPPDTPKPIPAIAAPIPEIVVTSSLHRLQYADPQTHTYFDRELAAQLPMTGEEIVRLTNRLPGTASGGISSRNHVRGGEENEVLFLFDGLRLYEPYHLRDFQSVASIVNSAAVGGIDFFTGAYPARYGDRMSGVMIMDLREPPEHVATELALSFFNASVVSMGRVGNEGDWLVSARRGNLDLIADVIDPEKGSPDYNDALAHFGWDFGPRARIAANVLLSKDKISLADEGRGERAGASYTNHVGWLRWDADWTGSLSSRTILAASDVEDRRDGTLDLPGIVSGRLEDEQDLHAYEIRQDWTWVLSDRWMWRFGANLKHLDAEYAHVSERSISAPFAAALGNPEERRLDFDFTVDGAQYAAYSELRWRMAQQLVFDLGLRWDQQTYPIADDDRQYSPRVSLLWQPSEKTEIRFGWGQFYQAQETNELQLGDGVSDFFPAQRAEHFVLHG